MGSGRQSHGQLLAGLGGVGLAASLWLPWFTVSIPQSALDAVVQASKNWGTLAPLVSSGARLISQLGPFHVTAWQALHTLPAVLLGAAIIGGGLAMLSLSGAAANASQVTMLAGGLAAVLVGYRIFVPPVQGSFVHPAWAAYLAGVSALAMLAGGAVSRRARPESLPVLEPRPIGSVGGPAPTAYGPPMPNVFPVAA
ncbi:MAG TPA: hypothetical protein VE983_04890, partial [Solirubrobacteraceae bacterium]|nr:hypothetical protein [Solirubrobacteraceae bacterium]